MKSALATELARQAKEKAEGAKTLLESSSFDTSRKTQSLFIVGEVTAQMLATMAGVVGFLAQTGAIDEVNARRAKTMERNDAIRLAASAGNWEKFDQLVEEFGGPGSDGT